MLLVAMNCSGNSTVRPGGHRGRRNLANKSDAAGTDNINRASSTVDRGPWTLAEDPCWLRTSRISMQNHYNRVTFVLTEPSAKSQAEQQQGWPHSSNQHRDYVLRPFVRVLTHHFAALVHALLVVLGATPLVHLASRAYACWARRLLRQISLGSPSCNSSTTPSVPSVMLHLRLVLVVYGCPLLCCFGDGGYVANTRRRANVRRQ